VRTSNIKGEENVSEGREIYRLLAPAHPTEHMEPFVLGSKLLVREIAHLAKQQEKR
jgi:hypothetical protein